MIDILFVILFVIVEGGIVRRVRNVPIVNNGHLMSLPDMSNIKISSTKTKI